MRGSSPLRPASLKGEPPTPHPPLTSSLLSAPPIGIQRDKSLADIFGYLGNPLGPKAGLGSLLQRTRRRLPLAHSTAGVRSLPLHPNPCNRRTPLDGVLRELGKKVVEVVLCERNVKRGGFKPPRPLRRGLSHACGRDEYVPDAWASRRFNPVQCKLFGGHRIAKTCFSQIPRSG
jgi:hypothetical protein